MRFKLLFVFFIFLVIFSPVYANEFNLENTTLEQQYSNMNITDSNCANIDSINFTQSRPLSSNNLNSTIECDDLTKVYGNDSDFTTTFYHTDGTLLTNSEVSFNLAGKHNNYITDNNGKVVIPINYTPGIYYVGINNPITEDYLIKKITILPQIESHNLVKIYGNSSSFIVRLLRLDGNPVQAGETVTIRITGPYGTTTYYRQTDNEGYAVRTIGLVPGEYNVSSE
ncbi:hypothetical protein [Methanobrevibacter sp.]|uniref:hypothetical protein n=1 Tax=Methanobrevibacter sp. TaxID=66852 RepID=UPI0025DBEE86|nr:hypothetical protein [Methanobrevibacter sp.]MBQ2665374.1 hypothetical protein [Methanobrevibacter sp.]